MEKLKILVVEDNSIIAQDLAQTLEDIGYEVIGIENSGENAIKKAESTNPDLILMDINLNEEMDGIEAAALILKNRPTPIIYLTAYSDEETVEKAKLTNPYAYIVKPFDENDLRISIDLAIHNFSNSIKNKTPGKLKESEYMINDSIFIKKEYRYEKIPIKKILFIEASGSYVVIYTEEGKYTLAYNLNFFINRINHESLVKVHRSYVVNIKKVTGFEGNHLFISDHEIPISKTYRDQFFNKIRFI